MFRKMRRNKQLLSIDDIVAVMERCTNGVLACMGDNDYPYAVPLSYVYFDNKIYFHSAKVGHKVDAIIKNPKVSFSVIFVVSLHLEKQELLRAMNGSRVLKLWLKNIQEISPKKQNKKK